MDTKYKKAVEYAKSKLSIELEKPSLKFSLPTDELEQIGLMGFVPSAYQQESMEALIAESEDDPKIREILQLGLARAIEEGIDIPDIASLWLSRLLRRELRTPANTKGRPQNSRLQALIFHTVQDLVDHHEMNPTRNDSSPSTSASDAVADALRQLGQAPSSYDRVRKIWQAKPALRVYIDE